MTLFLSLPSSRWFTISSHEDSPKTNAGWNTAEHVSVETRNGILVVRKRGVGTNILALSERTCFDASPSQLHSAAVHLNEKKSKSARFPFFPFQSKWRQPIHTARGSMLTYKEQWQQQQQFGSGNLGFSSFFPTEPDSCFIFLRRCSRCHCDNSRLYPAALRQSSRFLHLCTAPH